MMRLVLPPLAGMDYDQADRLMAQIAQTRGWRVIGATSARDGSRLVQAVHLATGQHYTLAGPEAWQEARTGKGAHLVIPAGAAAGTTGPRYAVEVGPTGLHRIIRRDGTPLVATPVPMPALTLAPPPALRLDVAALLVRGRHRQRAAEHAGTGAGTNGTLLDAGESESESDGGTGIPNGEVLRWRREAAGLSQRDLAHEAGVPRSAVAEIERGRRNGVRVRRALAAALDRVGAPDRVKEGVGPAAGAPEQP